MNTDTYNCRLCFYRFLLQKGWDARKKMFFIAIIRNYLEIEINFFSIFNFTRLSLIRGRRSILTLRSWMRPAVWRPVLFMSDEHREVPDKRNIVKQSDLWLRASASQSSLIITYSDVHPSQLCTSENDLTRATRSSVHLHQKPHLVIGWRALCAIGTWWKCYYNNFTVLDVFPALTYLCKRSSQFS